ncbi:josephin domain-containing protein [Ditylenchus destructor]|nr:josephin domain-containing protein [Ditylenchus destructor]
MDIIFFEKQVSRLCAQHALNMLLQGQLYSVDYLADVAKELDDKEKAVLSPEDAANFQSHNFDDSGYFSIQVIEVALQRCHGIYLCNIDKPEVFHYKKEPSTGKAYICNLNEHWFTIRKFGSYWFILNSCNRGPKPITDTYLNMYMHEIANKGYSTFVVNGRLPECPADDLSEEQCQEYKKAAATPPPAKRDMRDGSDVIYLGDDEDEQLETAIAMSLGECEPQEALYRPNFANTPGDAGWMQPIQQREIIGNFPVGVWDQDASNTEDRELQKALQASYDEHLNYQVKKSSSVPPANKYDEDLKRAIELSLSSQDNCMDDDKPCSSKSIHQQKESQRHYTQSPVPEEKMEKEINLDGEWTTVTTRKTTTVVTKMSRKDEASNDFSSRFKDKDVIRVSRERSLQDRNSDIEADNMLSTAFSKKNDHVPKNNL